MRGLRNEIKGIVFAFLRVRSRLRGHLIDILRWYRGYNKGDISKIQSMIMKEPEIMGSSWRNLGLGEK